LASPNSRCGGCALGIGIERIKPAHPEQNGRHERPHQAIAMRYPAELYQPSRRPYTGLPELNYPFHDMTITVTECGRLRFGRRKINLSQVFAGQNVGVREVADHIWLISFMQYDLGFFDDPLRSSYQCDRNGPTPSLLECYLCLRRNNPLPM
jgi:putative transposase